jgi:hypothetical protein
MNVAVGPKQEMTVEVLRKHGRCRLQISGSSMLWPGDVVSIESARLPGVEVGDIVLYERCGRFFLHRIAALPVEKFPGRVITRGDSMPQSDPAVRVENLLGVVAGVLRGDEWVEISRRMTPKARMAAALFSKSSGLARLVLRVRSRGGSFAKVHRGAPEGISSNGKALPGAPAS